MTDLLEQRYVSVCKLYNLAQDLNFKLLLSVRDGLLVTVSKQKY